MLRLSNIESTSFVGYFSSLRNLTERESGKKKYSDQFRENNISGLEPPR
ncbi:hypothetical protein NSE_0870 [Neorickettsia sennetsu str. Miyayama]|uniref:Uncharacterized protein n=1 Tax=Ehrlichia sennetsu (strain ATCC VR-367 / Miyayama) TaxID=222891 RepID=Q2GCQ9_EHRS3|nr:hypothetical protein NSE_0870 [Neorickettsia sennetsu str. Miyayama]